MPAVPATASDSHSLQKSPEVLRTSPRLRRPRALFADPRGVIKAKRQSADFGCDYALNTRRVLFLPTPLWPVDIAASLKVSLSEGWEAVCICICHRKEEFSTELLINWNSIRLDEQHLISMCLSTPNTTVKRGLQKRILKFSCNKEGTG